MAAEHAVWTRLFEECHAALLLFARQYTQCHADAEDVVQETFLHVIRGGQQPPLDPTAYMFTAVRNRAIDFVRSEDRRKKREANSAQHPDAEHLFECPMHLEERRIALESALRRLPEDQREVIVLKVWAELTFPQIAAALGTNQNTAASRYRAAKAKLENILNGWQAND